MTQTEMTQGSVLSETGQNSLLSQLAHDDSFRQTLVSDPVATLAGFGIELDPSVIPADIRLPSIDQLLEADTSTTEISARPIWVPFLG